MMEGIPPLDVGTVDLDEVVLRSPAHATTAGGISPMNTAGHSGTTALVGPHGTPLPRDPVAAAVFQARRAAPTGKSLFVSGLHPDVDFTDLSEAFGSFGEVISCRVLRDAKTGDSRCIGYVNFTTEEAAAAALQALDGAPGPKGGQLKVKLADNDPSFTPEATTRIFVRFIPLSATVEEVRTLFSQFGPIVEIAMSRDGSRAAKKEPEPWNLAYITFTKSEDATAAVAGTDRKPSSLGPHNLVVKPAENPATRQLRQEWRSAAAMSLRSTTPGSSVSASPQTSAQPTPKGSLGVSFGTFPTLTVGSATQQQPQVRGYPTPPYAHAATTPSMYGMPPGGTISPQMSPMGAQAPPLVFGAPSAVSTPVQGGRFFFQQPDGTLVEVSPVQPPPQSVPLQMAPLNPYAPQHQHQHQHHLQGAPLTAAAPQPPPYYHHPAAPTPPPSVNVSHAPPPYVTTVSPHAAQQPTVFGMPPKPYTAGPMQPQPTLQPQPQFVAAAAPVHFPAGPGYFSGSGASGHPIAY